MIKSQISGGVVIGPDGKVLVVSQQGTSWSLPKGHVNDGEDLEQAARREIKEESGVSKLKLIKELGMYERYKIGLNEPEDKSEFKTITMFLFMTTQSQLKPIDPQNPEARWIDIDTVAAKLTHSKDKSFFENIISELKDLISKNKL